MHLEQEIDAGNVALQPRIFVLNAELRTLAGSVGKEDRVVAAVHQIVDRKAFAKILVEEELTTELADDVLTLGLQDVLRQAVAGDADRGHAANALLRVENVDLDALQQQFVGTGNACRPRTDDGHAFFVLHRARLEGQALVDDGLVGGVAFEQADGHRPVGRVAATGCFAETHADTTTGCRQRIFVEDDAERVIKLPALDAVNVFRYVDFRRAGFDAGGRGVDEAVLEDRLCRGQRLEFIREMPQRGEQAFGAGLAHAAERGFGDLSGDFFDFGQGGFLRFRRTGKTQQQIAEALRPDPAGGAAPAGFARRLLHVVGECRNQAGIRAENEKAPVGDERLRRIVRVKIVQPFDRRNLPTLRDTAKVMYDAVPNTINRFTHVRPPPRSKYHK